MKYIKLFENTIYLSKDDYYEYLLHSLQRISKNENTFTKYELNKINKYYLFDIIRKDQICINLTTCKKHRMLNLYNSIKIIKLSDDYYALKTTIIKNNEEQIEFFKMDQLSNLLNFIKKTISKLYI